MTEGFQVPMLAWTLGVHTTQVQASPVSSAGPPPPAPNVIFQTRAQRNAHLLPLLQHLAEHALPPCWPRADLPGLRALLH